MKNSEIFHGELELIKNHKYRECTREILARKALVYFILI